MQPADSKPPKGDLRTVDLSHGHMGPGAEPNPFEPDETPEQQDRRVGAMIRENVDKRYGPDMTVPRPIYQVVPLMTREEMTEMRKRCHMQPATFHYQDPTPEMLKDPLWLAIWDEIKTWDINVPTEYVGYSSATGNHVTAIYLALLKKSVAEFRYMRSE